MPDVDPESPATFGDQSQDLRFVREAAAKQNQPGLEVVLDIWHGTYEVSLGDERRTVSAGGCAILPRGIPHGFRSVGETPGRFVCLVTPG